MALFSKVVQADGSWRLRDENTGEYVGRIWATTHIDRLLRDSDLAETVAGILALPRAQRRAAAVEAFQAWSTTGGHSVDFSALAHTVRDGNVILSLGGSEIGYYHGEQFNRGRLIRFIRLAEEVFAARQLGTAPERNQATDDALDEFATGGAIDNVR